MRDSLRGARETPKGKRTSYAAIQIDGTSCTEPIGWHGFTSMAAGQLTRLITSITTVSITVSLICV